MNILVIGADGKMGSQVIDICKQQNICYVGVDKNSKNYKQQFDDECKNCDIAIDFSYADALENNVKFCIENKINIIVATTGHNDKNLSFLNNAKKYIAVFLAPNLSLGFYKMTKAIEVIDNKKYDVAIVEQHHKHKKDTPSGSAKSLQKMLEQNHKIVQCYGIRGGEEVGTHSVVFLSEYEKITITHQANSRKIFAQGAIDVAMFLKSKKKGLFYMKDFFEYEK